MATNPPLPANDPKSPSDRKSPTDLLLRWSRAALYLALAAVVAVICYSQFQAVQAKNTMERRQATLISQQGVTKLTKKHLATGYTDKRGRLLADPPNDAAQLIDPDTLVVAYDEDTDLEVQPIKWEEFQTHLAAATGKKIEIRVYENTPAEVKQVKDGKTHLVALHAADTPYLVNNAGFIPVAVVGWEGGTQGNRLDLAVRNNSNIRKVADLKGRTLTCTTPVSITGYRAAVALLSQEAALMPNADYEVNFSLGQKKSVIGLAAGEFEAAALSDDKVRSLIKDGRIKESDFRIVYQSDAIPRFTVGYVYNLKPELATKVAKAILDFKNEGGAVDEDSGKHMHFVPVDYQKEFEFVRKIDESFDPRLVPKQPKEHPGSVPAESST